MFCGKSNKINTSGEHRSGKRGPPAFNVNTRVALSCLHAGIGQTHINNVLATIDIPPLNLCTYKQREREVGRAVECIAKTSCQDSLNRERTQALVNGCQPDDNNLVSIPCSFDMGWQKRGKGHNSRTGHAAAMSLATGKVLDYVTKKKACRTCEAAKRAGRQPKKHDCRKNHSGSSKAMEASAAVELFTNVTKSNVKFSTYAGDDDSTTELHLKQKVPYGVEKWSDTVHIKRSLTTRLYNLSQRSKFPNCSILSQKVINYLVKCFTYCIAQNKGNHIKMKTGMQNIVPHAFGDHHGCDESWCGSKKDPENYNHRDLPYGKDLHGDNLKLALISLFGEYSTDTVIRKLVPAANSQRNESLNSVVGSKNPKIRYYGGSESNDFRVSCGISQINLGYTYIPHTLEALNIDPGFFCKQFNQKMERKTTMDKNRKSAVTFKRRRSQLNKQNISDTSKKEAKEGTMYQSNIGLNLTSETTTELNTVSELCSVITKEQQEDYQKSVPNNIQRPSIKKEKYNDSIFYNFVLFDTETNSTGKLAELCQLAAVDKSGKNFSCYILPNRDIDAHASKVNNLTIKTVNGIRTLCKDNHPVTVLPLEEALTQFLNFLKASTTEASNRTTKKVYTVLAGHNAATFDVPILLRNGGHNFVAELSSVNIKCADTLLLFKSLIKDKHPSLQNEQGQFPKSNQSSLYEHLFKETFEAHDALEDVSALRRILFSSRLALSNETIVNRSSLMSVKDAAEDMKYLDDRHNRLLSFKGKLYNPGHQDSPVKQNIAEKMAGSGLEYEDLKNLFNRFGRKGLVCILSQPPLSARSSAPRVTRTKRIVLAILKHFEEISKNSA